MVHVVDLLSRPQSVFALQKGIGRETERRYTKLTFASAVQPSEKTRPGSQAWRWFSVYQISHKGGQAKNEDRMGYCYPATPACCLADGMGGTLKAKWHRSLALQTMAALFQRDAAGPGRIRRASSTRHHRRSPPICCTTPRRRV